LIVSHFEVSEEHPENTSFSSMHVEDGIMVFEHFKLVELLEKPTNDRLSKFTPVSVSNEELFKRIIKGVVSEWKFKENEIDLIFAVGIGACKVKFKFEEVIIGWNIIK